MKVSLIPKFLEMHLQQNSEYPNTVQPGNINDISSGDNSYNCSSFILNTIFIYRIVKTIKCPVPGGPFQIIKV